MVNNGCFSEIFGELFWSLFGDAPGNRQRPQVVLNFGSSRLRQSWLRSLKSKFLVKNVEKLFFNKFDDFLPDLKHL